MESEKKWGNLVILENAHVNILVYSSQSTCSTKIYWLCMGSYEYSLLNAL